MDTRKIIKFGNSSFVITLPNEWVKKNKLVKGSEVYVSEKKDSVTVSTFKKTNDKCAQIEMEGLPFKLFNKSLISYYLKNYKYIKLLDKDIMNKLEEIRVFKDKLSSLEIIEINDEYVKLEDFTTPKDLNLNNLIKEIINMINNMFDVIESEKQINIHFISSIDSNINKLSFLAYKSINYNLDQGDDPELVKNSIYYWRIVSSFESIGDILKRIARYIKNNGDEVDPKIKLYVDDLKKYFDFNTNLLNKDVKLKNNLGLYLDKKQSLLREIELIKETSKKLKNINLVVSQLFKDLIGLIDVIVLSVIDLRS